MTDRTPRRRHLRKSGRRAASGSLAGSNPSTGAKDRAVNHTVSTDARPPAGATVVAAGGVECQQAFLDGEESERVGSIPAGEVLQYWCESPGTDAVDAISTHRGMVGTDQVELS